MNGNPPDVLRGVVERITYHSEETGYTVAKLAPEQRPSHLPHWQSEVALVGTMLGVTVGESVEVRGRWTMHAEYGKQFSVETMRSVLPATVAGMEKYLGSGLVKGVGPVTAKRIVAHFGETTLDVIDSEVGRLIEVPGVGKKRVSLIRHAWEEQRAIKEVMIFLQGNGVSTSLATKIYKRYGDDSIAIVQADPYRLAQDIYGIGFLTADKIAQALGMAPDSPQRIAAGVEYTLNQSTDEGHVYLPSNELIAQAAELLGVSREQAAAGVLHLRGGDRVKVAPTAGADAPNLSWAVTGVYGGDGGEVQLALSEQKAAYTAPAPDEVAAFLQEEQAVYLTPLYFGEVGVSNRLHRLLAPGISRFDHFQSWNWEQSFGEMEAESGFVLAEKQRLAVQSALTHRLTILTGGPGTGKCVSGSTLVRTATGLIPIQDLMPTPEMLPDTALPISVKVWTRAGVKEASDFYYGGRQPTLRVVTNEGFELEGTPNHKVIVASGEGPVWMSLEEIREGTYVAIQRTTPSEETELDSFAYFLGLFVGDGHADKRRNQATTGVIITSADPEIWSFLEEEMPKMNFVVRMNRHSGLARMYRIGRYRWHGRGGVAAVMRQWGCKLAKSREKEVPTGILNGSHSQKRSFLMGLFDADGTADKRDSSVELGMSNRPLLRTVQILLLEFGIIAILREKPQVDSWRLSIRGDDARLFYERIGFRIERKQALKHMLSDRANTNLDIVPCLGDGLLRRYISQTGRHDRRWWWKWKREVKGQRRPHRDRLINLVDTYAVGSQEEISLRALCDADMYWAEVVSVEPGETTVFDLHIPDGNEFVANGFVNHNTTVISTITKLLEEGNRTYSLCAPTGRAAKRLSETTGQEAKTIHRLLEFQPSEGMSFKRNEESPLAGDLLIVDEASMLDLILTNSLLKAVPPGMHLLLVGDVDQLPSVGAGNVLEDIIQAIENAQGRNSLAEAQRRRGEGKSPIPNPQSPAPFSSAAVVRLDTIFRQAAGSFIIENAHRINRGQMPEMDPEKATDFFLFRTEEPERAAQLVVELVQERIPRRFAIPPQDIQVLSPMHRGVVGVGALNEAIQQAINPPCPDRPERMVGSRIFRVGDRVMQIRNNYDKEVYNGDMGHITGLDAIEQQVVVSIDGKPVAYDFLELDELTHAYAVSVHKSQGSEFPVVVIPVLTTHYMMLQRNLLYTAVTRARRLVVLVGQPRAIGLAVRNNRVAARYTGLTERLTGGE